MTLFDKKGMMDDFFDFLFTVMIGFFLFFFLSSIVDNSLEQAKKETVHSLTEFHLAEKNLQTLRLKLNNREILSYGQVDDLIPKGMRIKSCLDYTNADDCDNDVLRFAGGDVACVWDEDIKRCTLIVTRVD